jgi:hypothetical protein
MLVRRRLRTGGEVMLAPRRLRTGGEVMLAPRRLRAVDGWEILYR